MLTQMPRQNVHRDTTDPNKAFIALGLYVSIPWHDFAFRFYISQLNFLVQKGWGYGLVTALGFKAAYRKSGPQLV